MSDLISRSELIKHFEAIQQQENAVGIDFVAMIDEIKEQPTAYDVDKIVEELEEAKHEICLSDEDLEHYQNGIDNAIEIVKQETEQYEECYKDCGDCEAYNKEKHHCPKFCKVIKETVKEIEENHNGWIPCNERLPEEAFGCLVTVMDCEPSTQTDFENILPYFVGYDGETWNDADGKEIPFEVIAWMPLPKPYKESD